MLNSNPTDLNIREHMMVHAKGEGSMNGVSGEHIGTVDHVEGDMIKLTKNDSSDGQHHYIPLSWVESVKDNTVHLAKDAASVKREWKSASGSESTGSA